MPPPISDELWRTRNGRQLGPTAEDLHKADNPLARVAARPGSSSRIRLQSHGGPSLLVRGFRFAASFGGNEDDMSLPDDSSPDRDSSHVRRSMTWPYVRSAEVPTTKSSPGAGTAETSARAFRASAARSSGSSDGSTKTLLLKDSTYGHSRHAVRGRGREPVWGVGAKKPERSLVKNSARAVYRSLSVPRGSHSKEVPQC